MRRLLAACAALALLATPAHAFNPNYADANGAPLPGRVVPAKVLPFRSVKPLAQRVLVVWDAYDDGLNQNNVKAEMAIVAKVIGPTFDQWMKDGDVQVDFCRSEFFELPADSISGSAHTQGPSYLWQTLGSYYPTVVCVGFSTDTSLSVAGKNSRKRYFCADSTTAKIVHIGGWNNASSWLANKATFGTCDTSIIDATFDQRRAAVSAYQNTNSDTLWFGQAGYGVRQGILAPGVTSVVRLFQPIALSGTFGNGADSAFAIIPTAGDSVAKPYEIMPVAWRVYWTGTHSVDFIKSGAVTDYDFSMGHVLTALVSRTTKIAPTKMAMEWDDVFDANPTTATRPTNAAYDSVYREFRNTYGIPVAIATNPRHAAEYYAAANPTREDAWASGAGWTWIRNGIPWVHHAHDSTAADISSGLVGRFGGYSTGNGSGLSPWPAVTNGDSLGVWGFQKYKYTHRNAASGTDKFTMVYRLQWSDSLRKAICPTCVTPPYLSFPNNELLPTDWRERIGGSIQSSSRAGYWTRWSSYQGNGTCTIDSTLWAFHYGLGLQSGDELFVRGSNVMNYGTGSASNFAGHFPVAGLTPAGDDAPKNWTVSGDNDSVVAKTPFSYPGERRASYIAGRLVKVRSIGCMPYDGGARTNWTSDVQRVIPGLMGYRTGVLTAAGFSPVCDSWSADPGGVAGGGAQDQKNFGTDHARIVYFHPNGSWSNATGPNGNYKVQTARLGLLGGLRVLDTVAGHHIEQWVYPWQVYDK